MNEHEFGAAVDAILKEVNTEMVSFKIIQTRMKERGINGEQKHFIDEFKKYPRLKELLLDGKKSAKNPFFSPTATKTKSRSQANNARQVMAKLSDAPITPSLSTNIQKEVEEELKHAHTDITQKLPETREDEWVGGVDPS